MVIKLAENWSAEVERGPGWLIVKLHCSQQTDAECIELAEVLWRLLNQHFMKRMVIELDGLTVLQSYLIGQLVMLHNRVHKDGGVLRLVGLSERNHEILKICRLDAHFPKYQSCRDAVLSTGASPVPR